MKAIQFPPCYRCGKPAVYKIMVRPGTEVANAPTSVNLCVDCRNDLSRLAESRGDRLTSEP